MSLLVLDMSALASWLLPSQATATADALFANWREFQFTAPQVFEIELRALMVKAERRAWFTALQAEEALRSVDLLEIDIRSPLPPSDLDMVLLLARKAGLNFYDALYLYLAITERAALASRDCDLLNVARRAGLTVHDLRSTPGIHEEAVSTYVHL
jgi:predicted nucleic acid-binding protein